jgi:hypothetical protein
MEEGATAAPGAAHGAIALDASGLNKSNTHAITPYKKLKYLRA